jgi:hypothetical protein
MSEMEPVTLPVNAPTKVEVPVATALRGIQKLNCFKIKLKNYLSFIQRNFLYFFKVSMHPTMKF